MQDNERKDIRKSEREYDPPQTKGEIQSYRKDSNP